MPVNNISYNPTFKSNYNRVKNGIHEYANTTMFFREDLDWKAFARFLKDKYADVKKVNFLSLACSDGSEPWSAMILLLENLGKDAEKFLPLKASDFDKDIIKQASSGWCNITYNDEDVLNLYTGNDYKKYFLTDIPKENIYKGSVFPKQILKENVEFRHMDAIAALNELQPKNNVVMCKNFWFYFQGNDSRKFADILAEKLDETSLVVIGYYEKYYSFHKLLEDIGFKETEIPNVYSKY